MTLWWLKAYGARFSRLHDGKEAGTMVIGHNESVSGSIGWRQGLAERIDSLGASRGRFVADPGPEVETVPAERFFEPEFFAECIARHAGVDRSTIRFDDAAERPGGVDLRAYVSRYVRHYAGSVSLAALVGLGEGIGLDLSISRCSFVIWKTIPFRLVLDLSDDEVVRCNERPASWSATGPVLDTVDEMRAHVWRTMYGEHLRSFVDNVVELTNLTPALLWTNVAEWAGIVSAAAAEYLDEEAARLYLDDQQVQLNDEVLPGLEGQPNPLRERLDWVHVDDGGFPDEVATRRLCCLSYLLEDRFGRLCANCPHLPVDEKVALIRERHGTGPGATGGEATKAAIERGLKRRSAQQIVQARERKAAGQPAE
jgi:hypothetical protein